MDTAGLIRLFILLDVIGLALLALVYLAQRQMTLIERSAWMLLSIALPILGPFLVIACRPGRWDADFSLSVWLKRFGLWFQRLLPVAPPSHPARYKNEAKTQRKPRRS